MLELKVGAKYLNAMKEEVALSLFSNNVYTGRIGGRFVKYSKNGIALEISEYDLTHREIKEEANNLLTPMEQRSCDEIIDTLKDSLNVDKGDVFDILSMIVDSQDIKQSLIDFCDAKDIEL